MNPNLAQKATTPRLSEQPTNTTRPTSRRCRTLLSGRNGIALSMCVNLENVQKILWNTFSGNKFEVALRNSTFPHLINRAKSLLGKGQVYLPKEGFKKAYTWAEDVIAARNEENV